MRTWLLAVLLACCIAWSAAATAGFATGDSSTVVRAGNEDIEVLVYKPANYSGRGLIVSLHGLARNAAGYRNYTRPLAERFGALLVVPLFDQARFPTWRYQYAGISRRSADGSGRDPMPPEQWTSESLRAVIDQVRNAEGAPAMPYVLLGHSAGGQFLSRVAAFSTLDPVRTIIANPGTWVMPSLEERFPYGFAGLPAGVGGERTLERYLAQPLTVLVGTSDTGAKDLNTTPGARRQGDTRHARALSAFRQAEAVARSHNWRFGWSLIEISEVGHNTRHMYASPLAVTAFCPDHASRPEATWPCQADNPPAEPITKGSSR